MLDAKEGFFASLVPAVVSQLGHIYPEIRQKQPQIEALISEEEIAFSSMLSRGIKEFEARAKAIKKAGGDTVDGEGERARRTPTVAARASRAHARRNHHSFHTSPAAAFFLYDSMGFPLDLTQLMAREASLSVDADGFAAAMASQKARSAAAARASKGAAASLSLTADQTAQLTAAAVPPTDDAPKYDWEAPAAAGTVAAILTGDELLTAAGAAADGGTLGVLLDATSFYAEGGGQAADVGSIAGDGYAFDVQSVQSFGGYVLHIGSLKSGAISVGDAARCDVDYEHRKKVAPNHTLTHLLNFALRKILGGEVDQKGSDVDANRLRFDFTHPKALTAAQLQRTEALVSELVEQSLPVRVTTFFCKPADVTACCNHLW